MNENKPRVIPSGARKLWQAEVVAGISPAVGRRNDVFYFRGDIMSDSLLPSMKQDTD